MFEIELVLGIVGIQIETLEGGPRIAKEFKTRGWPQSWPFDALKWEKFCDTSNEFLNYITAIPMDRKSFGYILGQKSFSSGKQYLGNNSSKDACNKAF